MSIDIHAYQKDTKPQVLKLLALNTPEYFAPSEMNDFEHYLDNLVDDYYTVSMNDDIIACGGINYFPNERKAHISWDIIHPSFQRQGIGTILLQHRIQRILTMQDFDTIIVNTSQLVEAFYAANGFTKIALEKNFWGEGLDLVKMEFLIH